MRILCRCIVAAALAMAWGCSKESPPSGGSQAVATAPASAPATTQASRVLRSYQAIPASLLEPPKRSGPSIKSEFALFQVALEEGSIDEAERIFRRIAAAFPGQQRLHIACGLELVATLMDRTPPDRERATKLLGELKSSLTGLGADAALRAEYEDWVWVTHLAGGRQAVCGNDQVFDQWLLDLTSRTSESHGLSLPERTLLGAVDGLMAGCDAGGGASIDRIETVLACLQVGLAWQSPEMLRAFQERRVKLLTKARRWTDALFEARLLLALSSPDAEAWRAASDRTASLLQKAELGPDEGDRFRAFQKAGPQGPDGRTGTADDLTDPLARFTRDAANRWATVAKVKGSETPHSGTGPTPARSIQSGILLLMAGKGTEAVDHFAGLCRRSEIDSDRVVSAILEFRAIAQSLRDGHALDAQRGAVDLIASAEGSEEQIPPFWLYEANQWLTRRDRLIRRFIEAGEPEIALGMCRTLADDDRAPARTRSVIEMAWEACEKRAPGGSTKAAPLMRAFGQTLSGPRARISQVRYLAEKLKDTGDDQAVLMEIESLKDIWDQAVRDPFLALLHASCLVRLGRSSEALPDVDQLCARSDVAPEWSHRARLLQGVIHVQEGRPAAARDALRRLLAERPSEEMRLRALAILNKIQM